MAFEEKKIGIESKEDLLQCRINTVEPYALMLAPVYVFMKRNAKLVSVKAPLDFFTPDELNHLARYEVFYIPKSVQAGSRFQTAAKVIRNLIQTSADQAGLTPAVYEISNEVLKALLSLWGKDVRVDPFFCAVFADQLFGSFKPEKMIEARETAVVRHDAGILLSSVMMFVLLHLGWLSFELLSGVRREIYESIVDRDENWEDPHADWQVIARDLKRLIVQHSLLSPEALQGISSEWAWKLSGRLERIKNTRHLKNYPSLIISEEKGISA